MKTKLCKRRVDLPKEYLNVTEAGNYLRCSYAVVKKILASGEVPYRKIGRRVLISRENLRRWASGEQLPTAK